MDELKDYKYQELIENTLEVKLLARILENYKDDLENREDERSMDSDEEDEGFEFKNVPFWEDDKNRESKFQKLRDQHQGEDTAEGFIILMAEKYKEVNLCQKLFTTTFGKRIILKLKTLQDDIVNLNFKIKTFKKSAKNQMKFLSHKIETSVKDKYAMVARDFLEQVKVEVKFIYDQMVKVRNESMIKDSVIEKLSKIISSQE